MAIRFSAARGLPGVGSQLVATLYRNRSGRTEVSSARNLWVGARWAQRAVIAIVLCPMSSCTVFKSTPAITIRPADACRGVRRASSSIRRRGSEKAWF